MCAANALSLSPLPSHIEFFICWLCCFLPETRSHGDQTDLKIAKGDFKLMVSLPLPPKCLDYRYESLSLKTNLVVLDFILLYLFILNTLDGKPTPSPYLSPHVYLL